MNNTIYFIWLSKIKEISPIEKINLLKKYTVNQLWNLDKSEAISVLKSEEKANALLDKKYKIKLEKDINYMNNNDIKIITMYDKKYPINLKNIYDFPISFYAKGNIDILDNLSIAIVGSRNISDYGKKISEMMGYSLAKNNINVISGLAKGIDANAHIGAIRARRSYYSYNGDRNGCNIPYGE